MKIDMNKVEERIKELEIIIKGCDKYREKQKTDLERMSLYATILEFEIEKRTLEKLSKYEVKDEQM